MLTLWRKLINFLKDPPPPSPPIKIESKKKKEEHYEEDEGFGLIGANARRNTLNSIKK